MLYFTVPKGKGGEEINLKIPFPNIEKIALTRDNYYGSDTCLFNLSFRDEQGKSFTLRFAPIIIIPRRRIALQEQWFDFLSQIINASAKAAPPSSR
jgi:hypothetical protein